MDLQLYIALVAYAQDVNYFYKVLRLQTCMFKDIDLTHKSLLNWHDCSILFDLLYLVVCVPTNELLQLLYSWKCIKSYIDRITKVCRNS